MAQIRFEDIQDVGLNSNQNKVGFFSLKNNGDEALVRIMHDSTDSFEIVSTHQIEVNGKYRRINCCRSPYDPIENCPICATGKNAQSRFYVHLIQYIIDADGRVTCEPKIWERPASFANTLKNLITNYGPLSNSIFKIHRNGVARAMDTTYDIMYMPPQQYPETVFKKITDAFEGYSVIGTVVMNRTPEDIVIYLQTGNFPMPKKESQDVDTVSSATYIPPQGGYVESHQVTVPVSPATNQAVSLETYPGATFSTEPSPTVVQPVSSINRPVRYY